MKRLIVIILVIALLLPVVSLAEYSPGLNMTMYEFLLKYNAIQAALEAPYKVIAKAELWTTWNDYHIAWFTADKDNKTTILLMTKDPSDAQMLTSGLDMIQIFSKNDSDFDLSDLIYEYIILSLPIHRTHDDESLCNQEVLERLHNFSQSEAEVEKNDNPMWAEMMKELKDKLDK